MKSTRNRLFSWLVVVMIVGMLMISHTITAQASSTLATTCSGTFIAKKGDTLSSIARRCGVTLQALMSFNKIKDVNFIKVGQRLRIPTKFNSATPTARPVVKATPIPAKTEPPPVLPTNRPNN